jgi:hypothetical protein
MKKYIPTEKELSNILKMYKDELLGSHAISLKTGLNKQIILRVLKENGVEIGPSGRRFIGGRKVAMKKYESKPETKERKKQNHKKWYDENKDKWNLYIKEYREKNIDRIREAKRTYEKTRKANDPIYKLINNFRTAIYQVLKENNVKKNGHYFEILRYTPDELINHLESKFTEGMTWDNYGEWHVDHILPISYFQIQEIGDEQFIKCWELNNLQPMWGEENIKKSNKIL